MSKSQYDIVKKYRKRKQGVLTIKNMILAITIIFCAMATGYSYWNSTLVIRGTVTGNVVSGSEGETYDPSEPEEGTHTYTGTPGSPTVTVENGEVTSFEFNDTTGTEFGTGENGALDTGIVAFDGSAFTIHARIKINPSENDAKFIISALEKSGDAYSGFSLYVYNSGYLRIATYVSRTRSSSTGLLTPNMTSTLNSSAIREEREFDIYITYDPKGYKSQYAQITVNVTGLVSGKFLRNTNSLGNVPTSLTDATITLDGNGVDNQEDVNSMTVYEFSVTKTSS